MNSFHPRGAPYIIVVGWKNKTSNRDQPFQHEKHHDKLRRRSTANHSLRSILEVSAGGGKRNNTFYNNRDRRGIENHLNATQRRKNATPTASCGGDSQQSLPPQLYFGSIGWRKEKQRVLQYSASTLWPTIASSIVTVNHCIFLP